MALPAVTAVGGASDFLAQRHKWHEVFSWPAGLTKNNRRTSLRWDDGNFMPANLEAPPHSV